MRFYLIRRQGVKYRGDDVRASSEKYRAIFAPWLPLNSARIGYAKFFSRTHQGVICVYDKAGSVIETHEHAGDFKEW
jgi:hypothetical protein